jgi:hypothetical protein
VEETINTFVKDNEDYKTLSYHVSH